MYEYKLAVDDEDYYPIGFSDPPDDEEEEEDADDDGPWYGPQDGDYL
jgi:hypothetical protein